MSETQMMVIIVLLSLVCLFLLITEIDPSKHYQKGVSDGFRKGYEACAKNHNLKDVNPDGDEEYDWQGSGHDEPPKKTYQSNGVKVVSMADPNPDDGDEIDSLWLTGCGAELGGDGFLYFRLKTHRNPLQTWQGKEGFWNYHSDSFGGGRVANRGELRELFKAIGEHLEEK